MRSSRRLALGIALAMVSVGGLVCARSVPAQQGAAKASEAALFGQIYSVLTSPRCLNCHTTTNFPRQGNDRHAHIFFVTRGPDDRGLPWARCTSCHGESNNDATGIPGRPDWHMAPLSMGWEGLSPAALCRRLLNKADNGNRSPEQVLDHIINDQEFVAWAWSPGRNLAGVERSVPPIPRPEFDHLVEVWIHAGAVCPS